MYLLRALKQPLLSVWSHLSVFSHNVPFTTLSNYLYVTSNSQKASHSQTEATLVGEQNLCIEVKVGDIDEIAITLTKQKHYDPVMNKMII